MLVSSITPLRPLRACPITLKFRSRVRCSPCMPCRYDSPSNCHGQCRRLPRLAAPGSSLVSASLTTSNAQHLTGSTSSAFREAGPSLLRPRLTSTTTSMPLPKHLAYRHRRRPFRVRRVTYLPYICRMYNHSIRMTSGFESFSPLAHETAASFAVRRLRPGACLLLLSDSTSRWTPLQFS
jgi:hypothetical protein